MTTRIIRRQVVLSALAILICVKCVTSNLRDEAAEQLTEYRASVSNQQTIKSAFGAPFDSVTSVLTVGPRGDMLVKDTNYFETMAHFVRERIPERVVHAKGAGAKGYFKVTHDITKYTKAKIFSEIGKSTRIAIRFSTVGGSSGSADTVRDPRGFAIKFYTEDGNWDLVGNNTPLFFIRDPILFPNFIHTQKVNPVTHLRDWDMYWDFLSLRPESTFQVMFMFSDRGIPDGYQHMDGFGANTFKLVNKRGEAVYCKFHFRTEQGVKGLTPKEAEKLAGSDPDYSTRKLYNAIRRGEFPKWKFYIQVMPIEQAEKTSFNPFDVTKIWPENEFPLKEVGFFVLDENPKNYFADVEQIAFCPSNLVPGIETSPDKMLQGRLFAYADAQRYRLGVNFNKLPINFPYMVNITNYERDGIYAMGNQNGAPNYYPNSFKGPIEDRHGKLTPYKSCGDVERYSTKVDDNFSQPAVFWESTLDDGERKRLVENLVSALKHASDFIQKRAVDNFYQVNKTFGDMMTASLKAAKNS